MLVIVTQFIASAATIVVAGLFLAKAADLIAEITKLSRLIVGSIFLATATSLPEMAVDISAVRAGMPNLAVGDLMGSSLFNLLILAIADLMNKTPQKVFSRGSSTQALSGVISINLTAVAAFMIYLGPQLEGVELGSVGIGPIMIAIFYIMGLRLIYNDQLVSSVDTQPKKFSVENPRALINAITQFGFCSVAIFVASPFMASSAGAISEQSGLSKTFVGSTLVAFCTSLPEFVSTLTAMRMGALDLAVGNIFGSNAFNMLILLPLDLINEGPLFGSVSRAHILTALATIIATSIALMGQLYRVEKRKTLFEPNALAIIAVVLTVLLTLSLTNS